MLLFFFFNDTATPEIYPLPLHDALPISRRPRAGAAPPQDRHEPGHADARPRGRRAEGRRPDRRAALAARVPRQGRRGEVRRSDRKSTRLNSSHANISYAVFCLKKKKKKT